MVHFAYQHTEQRVATVSSHSVMSISLHAGPKLPYLPLLACLCTCLLHRGWTHLAPWSRDKLAGGALMVPRLVRVRSDLHGLQPWVHAC